MRRIDESAAPGRELDARGFTGVELRASDATGTSFRPGEPYHRLLVRFVALHRERILAGRSMTAAQLDGAVAGLEAHLADPATVTLYATFFQAWGRRPE